jgi:citrate synthase
MMNTAGTSPKGLEGVVAADTRLSDVRGDEGVLIYAGYNINELAGKISFEEVVQLLHENHLPNREELAALKRKLAGYRPLRTSCAQGSLRSAVSTRKPMIRRWMAKSEKRSS